MERRRLVEVFTAGCPVCAEVVQSVQKAACPSCHVSVLDMNDDNVAARAGDLEVRSLPAVAIDGELASCCSSRGPDLGALKEAGLGTPL